MTAIISRSPESATQATPAARERKAEKPAVAELPTAQAPTAPAAEAADWQRPVRAALAHIADLLDQIEEPPSGWVGTDTPSELIGHVARWARDTLQLEGDDATWTNSNTVSDAILWPSESLSAAVELGTLREWAVSAPEAFALLAKANDQLTALQDYLDAQPVAAAKPFQDKPRPPIRRDPACTLDVDEIEAFADKATRAADLVTWCVSAHAILESIGHFAEFDADFRASLSRLEIAYRNADWQRCRMDQGLADVLHLQSNLIRQIAGGAA